MTINNKTKEMTEASASVCLTFTSYGPAASVSDHKTKEKFFSMSTLMNL